LGCLIFCNSLRRLPDWIKGAIGLVTLIIGFIVLSQDNLHLSVVVSVSVVLAAVFLCSAYLAFSKKDSEIIGGGRVYRFPSYRRWASATLGLVFILVVVFLAVKPSRTFVITAFTGTATPAMTWRVRVYHFQNYGELARQEHIGEVFSGLILDELLRTHLNVEMVTTPSPRTEVATSTARSWVPTTPATSTMTRYPPPELSLTQTIWLGSCGIVTLPSGTVGHVGCEPVTFGWSISTTTLSPTELEFFAVRVGFPDNPIEEYKENAPFIAITGFVEDAGEDTGERITEGTRNRGK